MLGRLNGAIRSLREPVEKIDGFCRRSQVERRRNLTMFTFSRTGRTLAVLKMGISVGVYLVLEDEEYDEWTSLLRPTRVQER